MPKKLWFVNSGVDMSHLWDVRPFDTLRDARKYADNLPLTPFGEKRPFKIERAEYTSCKIYGNTVKFTKIV